MRLLFLTIWLSCQLASFAQTPPTSPGPAQQIKLDAQTRKEVIEAALKALNDKYVFPETAKKMEAAIRERMARGEYDKIDNPGQFARMLTEHLFEVSRDRHLGVNFSPNKIPPPPASSEPTPEQRDRQREQAGRQNFGFVKVERLDGNIGYLDVRMFANPEFAGDTAAAALNFLHNTDALIIDLRQNSGDIGQMRLFNRAQGRPLFLARMDFDFFQQSGGIKSHSILSSSDYRLEILAQRKKDDKWLKLTIETETAAPYHARNLGFSPAEPPVK